MYDLSTKKGYVMLYFEFLPQYKTKNKCFEFVNIELENINGFRMFKDYVSFKKYLYK
jgi:hypothetical protein